MNKSRPQIFLALLIAFTAGCADSTVSTRTEPKETKSKVAEDQPFPVLTKGMTADVVRQKLGTPAEVNPMPSPVGKAEVWVYHFEKTVGMAQVAASVQDIPVFGDSRGGETFTQQQPVYTTVTKKSRVTLSLLMFNGQLTAQKAAVENLDDYNS